MRLQCDELYMYHTYAFGLDFWLEVHGRGGPCSCAVAYIALGVRV